MVDLEGLAEWCPDLLLWVLLLGRSGANPLEINGRAWFSRTIGELEGHFEVQVPGAITAVAGLKYFELAEATVAKWRRKSADVEEDGDVRGEGW